jgi:hypothetical protein
MENIKKNLHIRRSFTFFLFLTTFNAFSLVGGAIVSNPGQHPIWALKVCKTNSGSSGSNYSITNPDPCRSYMLGTATAISRSDLVTAAHVVESLLTSPEDFKMISLYKGDVLHARLNIREDFSISLPEDYLKKLERNKSLDPCDIEVLTPTCGYDVAIIRLTNEGLRKISFTDYYEVNLSDDVGNSGQQRATFWGYGIHDIELYTERRKNISSLFTYWVGASCFPGTFVRKYKIDDYLRSGSNLIQARPFTQCNSLGEECSFLDEETYVSYSRDNLRLQSQVYGGSGDSGGPLIVNGSIVGTICAFRKEDTDLLDNKTVSSRFASKKMRRFFRQNGYR